MTHAQVAEARRLYMGGETVYRLAYAYRVAVVEMGRALFGVTFPGAITPRKTSGDSDWAYEGHPARLPRAKAQRNL